MAFLEVRNLQKHFGAAEVLKHVSFSMEQGTILTILGNSGSGKTTLLRCLNALEAPDGGEILVNGVPQSGSTAVRSFGLVFQNFNLFPHYNVLKNIHRKSEIPGIKQRFFRQMIPLVLLTGEGSRIVSKLPVLDMKLRRKHIMLCAGC